MELTGILIIGFIIVGFIAGLISYGSFSEGFAGACLGCIFGGLLSLFLCALAFPCALSFANPETKCEVISVQELAALKDESDVRGDFFLGCGTIEKTQYIYYISYEEGKGYMTRKENANYAYIDYITREGCEYEKPVKVVYREDYANPFYRFITWSIGDWTTFYVPEGSVLENYYSIDLE